MQLAEIGHGDLEKRKSKQQWSELAGDRHFKHGGFCISSIKKKLHCVAQIVFKSVKQRNQVKYNNTHVETTLPNPLRFFQSRRNDGL